MGGQISSSIHSHSRPRQVEMMIIFVPFLLEFLNFYSDTSRISLLCMIFLMVIGVAQVPKTSVNLGGDERR